MDAWHVMKNDPCTFNKIVADHSLVSNSLYLESLNGISISPSFLTDDAKEFEVLKAAMMNSIE